jgi:phosphoglucomutase
MGLLAAEMTAVTGRDPGELYRGLTAEFGESFYERIDAPATPEEKARLAKLSPEQITASELAGERITALLTTAPGNHAPIGGLKVVTPSGWFAARPSGTENVYKLYAESFKGSDHLRRIQEEAQAVIQRVVRPSPR